MITVVTGFIAIPGHPRSPTEYHQLGFDLAQLDVPMLIRGGKVENCWLYQHLRKTYRDHDSEVTHSVSYNPAKNTLAYHIVQAQKSQWLAEAADFDSPVSKADTFVWIDYGIFHVPGVTAEIIRDFLVRADGERSIAIPGCWDKGYAYDDAHPCWRFCGGVMVVPRRHLLKFDHAMKGEYVRWLRATDNLSWEVNTLARVERRHPRLPIRHYKADHDASMFTAYRGHAHVI